MAHRGGGPEGSIDVVWTLYSRLAEIVERLDRLAGSRGYVPEGGRPGSPPQLHVVEDDPAVIVLPMLRSPHPEPDGLDQRPPAGDRTLAAGDGAGG